MDLAQLGKDILKNPSPVVGGVLGGILTGGLFGWVSHVRGVRPILVFIRDHAEAVPRWKIRNIGQGPAMHIRIRDYESDNIVKRKVRPYALEPGNERPLTWVTAGFKLEADYTDIYGRRWYRSTAKDNETVFRRRYLSFWRHPSHKELSTYEVEIHVLRSIAKTS